ncbi:MAG: CBS domain-containing protein [bacterium]|nr:CBS domain-containing protein [bacterium]
MVSAWRKLRTGFARWLDRREVSNSAITFATAILVGVGAGLGAAVFRWFIGAIRSIGYESAVSGQLGWGRLLLVPALGGLIVGPLVYFWAREARGHGVPEVMEAVALRGGRIRPRVALVKALASGVCIGSGGSVGREGPIVQVGSAIGSTLGQALNFSDERIRSLVACGAAGGIAATFNAPIAGAIFAIEVILGRFHSLYFGAVVISAVVADVIAQAFTSEVRAFDVPEYALRSPWELLLYALLGVLAALLAVGFSRGLYVMEDLWDRLRGAEWIRPAIGGVLLGAIGILSFQVDGFPRIFGVGYDTISDALLGNLALQVTAALLLLKMLATWITLGSGGSGGVFAPSLFMGSMLGASFGSLANAYFPAIAAPPGAYALVGMAAFFSGAAHAPVTAILILFEMTGDYEIILPLMLATVVSTLLSTLLSRESIYTLKLSRRGVRLEKGRDVDVLQTVSVAEIMTTDFGTVDEATPLNQLAEEFARRRVQSFPVIDDAGELTGMVSISDLDRSVAAARTEGARVADIATSGEILVAYPDESMGTALRRLGVRDVNRLPVVERGSKRPIGVVRRNDIVRAYNHALSRRGQDLQRAEELGLGQVEDLSLVQVHIRDDSPVAGHAVREITLPEDCLIVSLRRGDRQRVVRGSTKLEPGDVVTLVAQQSSISEARRLLVG